MRRSALAVALACAVATLPRFASAQGAGEASGSEARTHFERGLTLLNAQNYEGALAEFQRSYQLNARPSVLYNVAVSLQALHRYPEAAHTLERYLHDATNLQPARRTEIERVLAELRTLIAHVRVTVDRPGVEVRLDGTRIGDAPIADSIEVGPGRHVVESVAGGVVAGREEFSIASGETREIHLAGPQVVASASMLASAAPTPAERAAHVRVNGVPSGASVEIDDHATNVDHPIDVTPGPHAIVVRAPGRATWRASFNVASGDQRVVTVRPARSNGLGPVPFYGGVVATLAFGAASGVFGTLALLTHDQFQSTYRPMSDQLATQGSTYETLSNVFLIATGVAAVVTVVLFTQTRFRPAPIEADVAIVPIAGGGALSVSARF